MLSFPLQTSKKIATVFFTFLLWASLSQIVTAHNRTDWMNEWRQERPFRYSPTVVLAAGPRSPVWKRDRYQARQEYRQKALRRFRKALERCEATSRVRGPGKGCVPKPKPVQLPPVSPQPVSSHAPAGGVLAAIRACESGGNYGAVSASGRYRGAYQFDQQTWESVGGSGDPAAASPAEQDRRAAALYAQRGGAPWPNCS